MDFLRFNTRYCFFGLLIAAICIIQPVLAGAGSVSITYRGPGGYSIGDIIVFDGRDTVGNSTLVKITGPGLPADGVPLLDLNGTAGSGNTVPVDTDGLWKFTWYTANTAGIDKIVTARYTITAMDLSDPQKTATTSIFLKKPEFYINVPMSAINQGDIVQLNGMAEQGVTSVKIDISDTSGKNVRTYSSPVSGYGSFDYEFRADMPPGRYSVTVSNPLMKNTFMTTFTVVLSGDTDLISPVLINVTAPATVSPALAQPVTTVTSPTPAAPLSPLTAIAGLFIFTIFALVRSTGHRK